MAGSRKWFKYQTNGGAIYAINRDESNVEQVNGSVNDYGDADTTPVAAIPRNIKPRALRYVSQDGLVSRTIVALTPAIFADPPNPIEDDVSGLTLRLKAYKGEEISAPLGFDTGLQDGDAT